LDSSQRAGRVLKASIQQTDWVYIAREAFLLVVCAYVILFGGGFNALVDFRIQAATTIIAIAVFGIWIARRIFTKSILAASGIDLAILLFLASQFIAVAFSEDPRRSLPHAIVWLVYVLVFYFTLDILRRGWPRELIAKCLLIVAALVLAFSLVNLFQLYLEWRAFSANLEFVPSFQQRLSSILGDPNLLAAFTNLIFPLGLASLLLSKNWITRVALMIYLAVSLLVLYFTDSRGGLLGLGATVTIFVVLWVLIISERAKTIVRNGAEWLWQRKIVLIFLALFLLTIFGFVASRFLAFEGSATHAPVADARGIFWQAAIDAVKVDPVTGAGPGMYPIYLMKVWSIPPLRPFLHAHGFPFQMAAESGFMGLAAFFVLLITVVGKAWTVWRILEPARRVWWVAAAAGLLGLLTHSLVDDFFPFPAVGFVAFVFLAFVISPKLAKEKLGQLSPWLIAVPAIAAAVFTLYCVNAYWHADKAVTMGSQGDWQGAATELQAAADADPAMGFYWLQAGYAYGRLAESDPGYLDEAVAAYERGISIEPESSIVRANLASLLWASNFQDQALHQMRIATSLAPESWIFLLNEGAYEEELGLSAEAISSYGLAVNFRSDLVGSTFWLKSQLRSGATQIATETIDLDNPVLKAASLIEIARDRIAATDFDSARSLLHEAYTLNDQNAGLYIGLGELALANGDLQLAEHYVIAALWILATDNKAKVEAILLGAEISLASGDEAEALRRYEFAFNAIFADTSYGWGSSGWSPYAWFVFQRRAFPEDLLPQLERADITTDIATKLLPLIDLYEEMGESQKAQKVSEALAPYLP
jgi:putative inorganic carbon (HCO3(-)) transporter